jgi:5,10-methylenetetrahydrofolate reductase
MDLKDKLPNPYLPVVLFEMVPPPSAKPEAMETAIAEAGKVKNRVDAINLPEIHDETRDSERSVKFIERVEPRVMAERIKRQLGIEVIINRCVVHDADPVPWFRTTQEEHGAHHFVLVGGESSRIQYPGPGVVEAASLLTASGLNTALGGISIPTRAHEAERVRRKAAAGLSFFTTQVLFDSNDIVWLIQKLNGLEARIFLSFAPVSHPRDLEFLRWLGADIPVDLDRFLLQGDSSESKVPEVLRGKQNALERSLDLCQRILMDVFDNLPPDAPPIGINIEHINKRNFSAALKLLDRLNEHYQQLVEARVRASLR